MHSPGLLFAEFAYIACMQQSSIWDLSQRVPPIGVAFSEANFSQPDRSRLGIAYRILVVTHFPWHRAPGLTAGTGTRSRPAVHVEQACLDDVNALMLHATVCATSALAALNSCSRTGRSVRTDPSSTKRSPSTPIGGSGSRTVKAISNGA
jgi:hypothetical protein